MSTDDAAHLDRFAKARVLVVGDVMLDRYYFGEVNRISPEAPVPVFKVKTKQEVPGGAANVARNVVALGGSATLMGVVGDDEPGRILKQKLAAAGVKDALSVDPSSETTVKTRTVAHNQQLMRLDFEGKPSASALEGKLAQFQELVSATDVVVFSDYGKGALARVAELIQIARRAGKAVLVDPKGADYTPYKGASAVTPNRSEMREVVGAWKDEADLTARAQELRKKLDLTAVLVTRSEEGMTLFLDGETYSERAQALEVFDVSGAGDTVIATLAVGLAAGAGWKDAVRLANVAGGIVVGKLGTATPTREEMQQRLSSRFGLSRRVLDEDALLLEVQRRKAKGEKIVMTNGCFDILHRGHVQYLENARSLGDCLIVAVNDDASVKKLKGPGRPVNDCESRMRVLAALGCVDYAVKFTDDTPERLICKLVPNVLVKGGDYKVEQVAGRACVEAAGGKVVIADFVKGFSTSAIIEKMK